MMRQKLFMVSITPYITTGVVKNGISQELKENYVKSLKKSILRKSNINNVRIENNTLIFDLSFLKNEGVSAQVTIPTENSNLIINLSKSYKSNYGFCYFDLSVWKTHEMSDTTCITSIQIPDSYKKIDDLVAYMHGIYRTDKYSCYEVKIDLNTGNLTSGKIKVF